jgi:hypothetical protein
MSDAEEKDALEWASYPAAERKRRTILLVLFLLAFWTAIYVYYGGFWFVVSVVVLGASVAPYFTVTRYKLTPEEVVAFQFLFTIRKPWKTFRSYYEDKRGVLLSPFDRPSRLENYRGLYLRFGSKKEQVMRYVKQKIAE